MVEGVRQWACVRDPTRGTGQLKRACPTEHQLGFSTTVLSKNRRSPDPVLWLPWYVREPHSPPCGGASRLPLVPCAHTIVMRPIKHVRGDPLAKRQRCAWAGDAMAGTPRTQTHSCDVRLLKTSAEAPE